MHLVASEYILVEAPGADVLLYSRNSTIRERFRTQKRDEESTTPGRLHRHNEVIDLEKVPRKLQNIEGILYWKNLSYEIPGSRHQKPLHLLTDVSGLVEPGKLTALMGATGAGKTTLLDVLSGRVSIGTISGQISYQRKLIVDQSLPRIGFVQQQDIHLSTSTVREALQFSATMRSEGGTLPEKMEYVEEVINILGMHPFANAMIGTPGQGLNVEQLRRLSIGVELVAKPDILLLDEPTSGLDSQTAWAICSLLQDLVQHGQTILCTIHQPSANLFEMFDKLLLIEKEGKVLYYGDIGNQAGTVTAYFQSKGGPEVLCASDQNPADWLFDIISTPGTDWYRHWRDSSEFLNLQKRLTGLCEAQTQSRVLERLAPPQKARAVHLFSQVFTLTRRTFTSYWRTPQYLWGNLIFTMGAAALISISCPSTSNGLQGLTIQVFAIFLFCTIFSNLSHQMLPNFVKYRDLFEIREGRSHTYSWQAFLTSIILVEGFWSTVASVLAFALFYFPLNMHNGDSISALLAWLYIWGFFLFTSTLSHLLMAGLEHAEVAANYGFLLFYLCLIFCGVLVPKEQLGSFWIFMYRVSPLTYIVAGLLTVGISHREVHCLEDELVLLDNPTLTTCREYLAPYLKSVGGRLLNPDAETDCQICPVAKGQEFLSTLNVEWASRWQYLGYIFAFVFFNVLMTFLLYWAVRVRKMRSIKIIDKDIKY
jgi:ATP-binding cassette subfamily G (WHITE) protein 2 (PDR)